MAPKHGLAGSQGDAKRTKSSQTSRSATPAEQQGTKVPFEVEYPIMDKNKKRSARDEELAEHAEYQVSPFVAKGALKEGELDQYYTVTPTEEWNSMKKYNNFISKFKEGRRDLFLTENVVQGDVFKNNQIVFVKGKDPEKTGPADQFKNFWIARILQVRAKNAQHVYALVAWLYWPDEIPPPPVRSPDQVTKDCGKRKYHANNELVASNYMEVLDVLTFAGKADVYHVRHPLNPLE
jgi:hypothetical protein